MIFIRLLAVKVEKTGGIFFCALVGRMRGFLLNVGKKSGLLLTLPEEKDLCSNYFPFLLKSTSSRQLYSIRVPLKGNTSLEFTKDPFCPSSCFQWK